MGIKERFKGLSKMQTCQYGCCNDYQQCLRKWKKKASRKERRISKQNLIKE